MKSFPFISKIFFIRRPQISLFLIFSFLSLIQTTHVYGNTLPQEFRVGLEAQYRNAATVPVGNTSIDVSYNGAFCIRLNSTSGFSITPAKSYYAGTEQYFSNYESAKSLKDSYAASGRNAVVVCQDTNRWSVYSGGYSSEAEARNAGTVIYPSRPVILSPGAGEPILFDNQNAYPQISGADGGFVQLGSRSYRGRIELSRNTNGNLQPINVISVNEYLYSVVSSEMPSGWHIEALKAQAVACRSYAYTRMGIHSDKGYGLCDASHCQNYIGAGNETAGVTQAVQATTGLLAYYENEPINAVYFSSSGGVTANSGDVWVNQFPYLTAVREISEPEAKAWSRSFSLSEITGLLSANNVNIGQAASVSIGSLSPDGRVNRLVITGTNGSKTLEKEDIRNFFSSSSGGSLESRNFIISNGSLQGSNSPVIVSNGPDSISANVKGLSVLSSGSQTTLEQGTIYTQSSGTTKLYDVSGTVVTSEGNGVIFSGRGWGHGVGMSQYGAKGMAETGYNFIQILEYYYTGARVY